MNWLFKTRWGKVLIHTLVWVQLMLLPFLLWNLIRREGDDTGGWLPAPIADIDWRIIGLFFALMISFFYFHAEWLTDRLFLRRKFGLYVLSVVLCWVASVFILRAFIYSGWVGDGIAFKNRRMVGMTLSFLICWFASLGHRLTRVWMDSERSLRDMETEKLKTELSFLQGQINPHFLFNTLNTIYTLARRKADQTADAVMQLSNLLRYVLDTPADTTTVEDEVAHLRDFIALHSLRLTDKTRVVFEVDEKLGSQHIAPMLLLPFVENAFKYGLSSHRESLIQIRLSATEDGLLFEVQNPRFSSSAQPEMPNTGIGLKNVRRRLELLYPHQHELLIQESNTTYAISLRLRLHHQSIVKTSA